MISLALSRRAELRATDEQIASLRSQKAVKQASYLPRLELFATTDLSNPSSRVFPAEDTFRAGWQAGAQITYTPSDIPSTRAAQRETDARIASLAADRGRSEDGIRIEVLSAVQDAREARAAVATAGKTLATAEEAYRVRRALFKNGRATSLEMSDAELDLTRASLDAVNARVDVRVARVQLERAVGERGFTISADPATTR